MILTNDTAAGVVGMRKSSDIKMNTNPNGIGVNTPIIPTAKKTRPIVRRIILIRNIQLLAVVFIMNLYISDRYIDYKRRNDY